MAMQARKAATPCRATPIVQRSIVSSASGYTTLTFPVGRQFRSCPGADGAGVPATPMAGGAGRGHFTSDITSTLSPPTTRSPWL